MTWSSRISSWVGLSRRLEGSLSKDGVVGVYTGVVRPLAIHHLEDIANREKKAIEGTEECRVGVYDVSVAVGPRRRRLILQPGSDDMMRLLSHSCNPNSYLDMDEEKGRAGMVAMRDVSVGEELTWSYGASTESAKEARSVRCACASCREVDDWSMRAPLYVRGRPEGCINAGCCRCYDLKRM